MEWLSIAADVIGVAGAVFALIGWLTTMQLKKQLAEEENRKNKKIKIMLKYGKKTFTLPATIRRAELTRAEVLGRLGMIPRRQTKPKTEKQERFGIEYLNNEKFFEQMDELLKGKQNATLHIDCTKEEFNQFDFS